MRIRQASVADAELIASFAARAFRAAFAAANDPENLRQYVEQAFAVHQVGNELAQP